MNSKERFSRRGNKVRNSPDRPQIETKVFGGGSHADMVEEMLVLGRTPLTVFHVVDGHPICGGTSPEALRRAKKNSAKS